MSEPRKSNSLKYEFQVLYKMGVDVPLQTIFVAALTDAAARAAVESAQCIVVEVTEVRALLDWQQQVFTQEEAAAYLRCSIRTLQRYQELGWLVKPGGSAFPIYRRAELDACITKMRGEKRTANGEITEVPTQTRG